MKELTEKQAIELAESKVWKKWTPNEVVKFQLFQEKLCMDFSHFHMCLEKELGRAVFTHELGFVDNIRKEFLGEEKAPSFEEIVNLIPEHKRLLILGKLND